VAWDNTPPIVFDSESLIWALPNFEINGRERIERQSRQREHVNPVPLGFAIDYFLVCS
jgi:hypothetical protein